MNQVIVLFLFVLFTIGIYTYWISYKSFYQTCLDKIDIIYWINLDRSVNRRKKMEAIFKDTVFNIYSPFQCTGALECDNSHKRYSAVVNPGRIDVKNKNIIRIKAIDGRDNNDISILNNTLVNKKNDDNLTYACLMSHLTAIEEFSKTNLEYALILEDDLSLEYKPYWNKRISDIINNAPIDWEIIMLEMLLFKPAISYFSFHDYVEAQSSSDDKKNIYCTGAYLINKKGAIKMMNTKQNNKFILDTNISHCADRYIFKVLKTYAYKYPYFTYPSDNDSTLHPTDVNMHQECKQLINKYIYNI
jgi:GR25 family glycosyltransferase involved in LPS biosynthesis